MAATIHLISGVSWFIPIHKSLVKFTELKDVLLDENFGKFPLVRLGRGGRVRVVTALRKQLRNECIGVSRDFRVNAWSDKNHDSGGSKMAD